MAARRQVPGAALPALVQEIDSCRRAPRRQGLKVVGYGGRRLTPWATSLDVHLSKILVRPIIFENHNKLNIKKSMTFLLCMRVRSRVRSKSTHAEQV
jgi:hypothetical protein